MVLVVPLPLLAVSPLVALLLARRRLKRRRKRVCNTRSMMEKYILMLSPEKEESDEDMGFGLFD